MASSSDSRKPEADPRPATDETLVGPSGGTGSSDRFPSRQEVRISEIVLAAAALEPEGLIHRDVKPSNVLVEVTPDGELKPWVADFGIAFDLDRGSAVWTTALAGTPYYIAPERLSDEHPVDRRSDIYSLGVTFYQVLCGELPFHDPSFGKLLRRIREEEPRPLRDRLPGLPAEIDAITMKCLAKDPDLRYPSARAVAEDLWRYLDGQAVEAHTATFAFWVARAAARQRNLLTAAFAAGGLLGLMAGLALVKLLS